ncbi:hypothetical protein [Frankia sp. R82]|uniref:hypothetical protein n=1 Tax=Frankia sp. R82 TaxID=2950553 RepID=UPI00204465EE|nr:hypothetical protein [Frankia sp. R82]MCM3882909.1 hypothetical protein [Frankia sp. R82]
MALTEALIQVPEDVRDRLVRIARDEGMSLRTYLTRLAHSVEVYTDQERREQSERALKALFAYSGYNPTEAEIAESDAELERRCAHLVRPRPAQ